MSAEILNLSQVKVPRSLGSIKAVKWRMWYAFNLQPPGLGQAMSSRWVALRPAPCPRVQPNSYDEKPGKPGITWHHLAHHFKQDPT
ncbi:hypothetical protein DPEC_G00162350 [Dallia pectoralis]|uniref:Uncharacterized protein n=1 Tax=Dallia pectoralis TaxID=75939 RepID=A0ACC2GGW4_DALPE|nr:hypothetical protein DPEC_G00162350 [Dallia pectoralis]